MYSLSVVVLQIDQLIACLQSSVNQQGLLPDTKREGRCPGDDFFFTVYVSDFLVPMGDRGSLSSLSQAMA